MLALGAWPRRFSTFVHQLARTCDVPVLPEEWARLCAPRALFGPHDWGLALGALHGRQGRRLRLTPLGRLFFALEQEGDRDAGLALAAMLARFVRHLEWERHFDIACKLPSDYVSGDGDKTIALFGWPEVGYTLPIRADLFAWGMAARLGAAGSERAMTLEAGVAGRRVLIVADRYRFEPTSTAVHLLRAAGASRVGVLTLCADLESVCDS
jgi:hypothetical protein